MSITDLAKPGPEIGLRLADARAQTETTLARAAELLQRNEQIVAEVKAARQVIADARRERRSSPAGRERLQRSDYERLLARLQTMPVIEQAKGIIMAQSQCGEAKAFRMLRLASQRSNIPVRDLAAQIVANTARPATSAATPGTHRPTSGQPGIKLPAAG